MNSKKSRLFGSLIGDELLDSNGVLIPKQEQSFYGPEYKKEEQPSLQSLGYALSSLEEKLGVQIQPEAVKLPFTLNKLSSPYENAMSDIKKDGYERFLMFSEIVEIKNLANSGDKNAEALYNSLAFGGDEWLSLLMEKKGKDLIFYEKPEGMHLEISSYDIFPPGSMKRRMVMEYDCSRISCSGSIVFDIGKDKMPGMDIPLSLLGSAMIGYIIGCSIKDYPKNMPGPVICLPPENKKVPVGFNILNDKVKIGGNIVYSGFREVKKIKK